MTTTHTIQVAAWPHHGQTPTDVLAAILSDQHERALIGYRSAKPVGDGVIITLQVDVPGSGELADITRRIMTANCQGVDSLRVDGKLTNQDQLDRK